MEIKPLIDVEMLRDILLELTVKFSGLQGPTFVLITGSRVLNTLIEEFPELEEISMETDGRWLTRINQETDLSSYESFVNDEREIYSKMENELHATFLLIKLYAFHASVNPNMFIDLTDIIVRAINLFYPESTTRVIREREHQIECAEKVLASTQEELVKQLSIIEEENAEPSLDAPIEWDA